jgi:hypothetical protein
MNDNEAPGPWYVTTTRPGEQFAVFLRVTDDEANGVAVTDRLADATGFELWEDADSALEHVTQAGGPEGGWAWQIVRAVDERTP